MIPLSVFLANVSAIVAKNPSYRLGGSGTDGTCDCIGLIIGAIRRSGEKWSGIHGSNYAARSETMNLRPIASGSELKIGEVVYKKRNPGSDSYSLPDRYRKGGSQYNGDLADYYHIGIVESVSPLRIRHMTSPKMRLDTKLGAWAAHGWLKKVSPPDSQAKANAAESDEKKASLHGNAQFDQRNSGGSDHESSIPDELILVSRSDLENAYDLIGNALGLRG
ncbi:MAG: hypothetical protein IJI08_08545 [Clostridia bacterium]|nr:hypothetical protein [Clostridia bacterium]